MSITWYDGIVVGVDGSAEALAALDWAAPCPTVVVHARHDAHH